MENPIIVITGPTASGKTALSLDLVPKYNGEIICVDSMTVYRGMDVGTDKPTLDPSTRREGDHYVIRDIPHHLLDILDPDDEFNVSICQGLIKDKVKEVHDRGHIPFLVGGSTLYIDTYAYDYKIPDIEPDPALRKKLEAMSSAELYAAISDGDPDAIWTLDRNNKRRLIRALEVIIKSGKPFSNQKEKHSLPENVLYLAVSRERDVLYEKINRRVDEMIAEGFLEEVKILFERYDHGSAMQAAGYKQLIEYLEGKISLEEAVEKTKQAHRNYAKRQITWLRRNKDVIWVDDADVARDHINHFLKN